MKNLDRTYIVLILINMDFKYKIHMTYPPDANLKNQIDRLLTSSLHEGIENIYTALQLREGHGRYKKTITARD